MTNEERELNEKELKQIEYEQLCEDWRHRDSMLWQSLAVAITLTGIIFGVALREDISWMSRFVLFGTALILNCVLILKISKDHYYQLGSNELLHQIGGDKISKRYDWRIHKPSDKFLEQLKRENKIPVPFLYKWLGNRSAFKCFFIIQMVLICIIFILLCTSIYFIFLSLTQSPLSGGGVVSTDTLTPCFCFR